MTEPSQAANAAIHYFVEGFDTSRQKLMGRHAAGEGFLKGFLRHSGAETLYCHAASKEVAGQFQRIATGFGCKTPIQWLDEADAASPASVGTLYLPDPTISTAAWRRRAVGQRLYSLCGVTHTTASAGAMDWIVGLLSSPVQEWDALICTSQVVRDTIDRVLGEQQEFLAARFGAVKFVHPQLPIIPLGVDTHLYATKSVDRLAARSALGLGENDIAILFVGRLSFHAKAHPLPMYLALERVAQAIAKKDGRKLRLIQAGWFANDFIEKAFRKGAAEFCPSVTCKFLDGRKADLRQNAWRAADIFTSLADNFQETFGLTPIEAMAAGLPGVVTDWNGYRDTVRDGIDGFRLPTLMPRSGLGGDMADRHAAGLDTYDVYCGHTSQFVAVDPNAVARAYMALIEDPDLRHRMGAAARKRAIETFDWSVIIKQYQALWQELAERRRSGVESAPFEVTRPSRPARADPFFAFESYATDVLAADHVLSATPGADGARLQALLHAPFLAFFKPMAPNIDDCARVLTDLQRRGMLSVGEILEGVPEARRDKLERGLVWLAKLGLVTVRGGKI
jgi:starch synthase